ncbi:nitrate/nitrite transporter [Marinobacterium arenosum]|uniref:nitrate/nitrite transporter n=1 Tax=Marinobacterium arenosum TaxID=2862496 RepID=UPI001C956619|nr:nitrate/nitrite transporter [Marinobacterium arenosum]MBY4676370.1 NarK/NasA family nitrate transporter [Marinobacterium arenosum]
MFAQDSQQQISALIMSTLLFAACFAVWTLVSVIGVQIKHELALSETQFGILVATPILTGALARLPMGLLAERLGGRPMMIGLILLVSVPLYSLSLAQEYWHYLLIGLGIGLAGSSFSVGIHYVSAWASRDNQGLAMGVFGAGNLGAALTNLIAPLIIVAYGWRMAPVAYSVVLVILAMLFWLLTQDDPLHQQRLEQADKPTLGQLLTPLADLRVWRFGLYYFFVFGGYVALTLWLPDYYVTHYQLDLKSASFLTLLFTVPGALTRIIGGWCADKLGARRVNWTVFWVCLVCMFFLSYPPTTMTIHGIDQDLTVLLEMPVWLFTVLVMVVGIAMGFGKASVFRNVYDYYPDRMGIVGGAVGSLGAIGGFVLPVMFGLVTDLFGVRSSCFMLLYGLLALCMITMYFGIRMEDRRRRLQDAIRNNFLHERPETGQQLELNRS